MLRKILCLALAVAFSLASSPAARGRQQCRVIDSRTFVPQNKRVRLVSRPGGAQRFVFFRTSLRVNTDGAPNSYHPDDLTGSRLAINNICNGVSATRNGVRLGCQGIRQAFAQFRDNNWRVPAGHTINWQNVIAARVENGRTVPCVFRTGAFAGYFGSLTSLKNDLTGDAAGECGADNQLDQRIIPAFVIPGGTANPLHRFGARVGDLLLAFNPQNNVAVAAVVGDVGPRNKLGEGSVGLNMALLGRTEQPSTYQQALGLDTGTRQMLIAVVPGSRTHSPQRPFTKENIASRLEDLLTRAGFATRADFVNFMKACNN